MYNLRLICFSFFFSMLSFSFIPQNEIEHTLKINEPAPIFILRDLEGQDVFLRDFCGDLRKPWKNQKKHIVILSFFTTYCQPCLKEIPQLEKLMTTFHDKELKIFLVNLKESKELVRNYVADKGFKLPVLLDRYGVVAKKYGVSSVPRVFIIDRDGKIIWMTKGYSEDIGKTISKELQDQF